MTLVTVIVPAFNAERTLAETLESIRAQTHTELEIIIVDDGSTDLTRVIARDYCASDPRARLVRKRNGGVGSARNRGFYLGRGEWFAPIDADDLWHPTKIERQLMRAAECRATVGLVYNWMRPIDENGLTIAPPFAPMVEGSVFREHLEWNFIGNGSTPLFRADAVRGFRYSKKLAEPKPGGCEDYLFQLELALRFDFACVPAFLTGYRVREKSMSADVAHMMNAHVAMFEILHARAPLDERPQICRQLARYTTARGLIDVRRGGLRRGLRDIGAGLRLSWSDALRESARMAGRSLWRFRRKSSHPLVGQPFSDLSPEDGSPSPEVR